MTADSGTHSRPIRGLAILVVASLFFLLSIVAVPITGRAQETMPTTVHIVQAGETVSAIAEKYGVTAAEILELNGIDDPDTIIVGQKLRIPLTELDAAAPAPPGMHRIQPGETLSEIAKRYAVDLAVLMELNDIDDPDAVFSGQLLALPPTSDFEAVPLEATATEPVAAATEQATGTATAIVETETAAATAGTSVAATAVPDVPATPVDLPPFHVVQTGETLIGIARSYGLSPETLRALNNIGNADFILVGQRLRIAVPTPEPTAVPATPEPTAVTEAATPAETAVPTGVAVPTPPASYTVQAGETLSGIAKRYGLSIDDIKALNRIEDENAIEEGQELLLVAPTPVPTAEATPTATAEVVITAQAAITAETVITAEADVTSAAVAAVVLPPAPIVRSGSPIASLNQTYTVRSGDFLARIALRLGVDPDALRKLNGFASIDDALSTGQVLLLPATGAELRPRMPAQEYVVQAGESLGAIARTFELTVGDLLTANRIADPNAVYPGQRLLIPQRTLAVDATSDGLPPQIGPARSGYFFYTVQSGDTLSAIAKQFGSTMQALLAYNNLPNTETVYTGMELKIPYGAPDLGLERPPVPFSGTRFVVSISRQQCWVFQGERVVHSWNCSTGAGERKTKAGNYAVQSKIANAKSNIFRLDMPYWLGIYDVGPYENGIHGLPVDWDTGKKIWSGLIGQPATFGCAMLDDLNAAALFRMAFLGMPVHVVN